jgi:hypothetical protein
MNRAAGRLLALVVTLLGAAGCDVCSPGDMRCDGSSAQMCDENNTWETYQDCGSIGEQCSTAPSACSGYTGLACCYY